MACTGWILSLASAPLFCPIGRKKREPGERIEKRRRGYMRNL
jgi:hypothetical protein